MINDNFPSRFSLDTMSNRHKQRGVIMIELVLYVSIVMGLMIAAVDILRYVHFQDRLHLVVSTVGPLAADIPPDSSNNVRFEQQLCGVGQVNLKHDDCPESEVTKALLKIALETMGLENSERFAMRLEFISDSNNASSKEFAKTNTLGGGSCELYPNVPGGIRLVKYLSNSSSTREVELKNRAHSQFIYVAACYQPSGLMSVVKTLIDAPLFADSLSLRRYWYSGDRNEV